ncbi:hypothetical protein B0A49_06862 [Cryomyces minteri]|uniref:GED domain-containing protein n=1 Tax=Cryomyces minteri TaxID=331657 RepID=A0A4V5NGD4_9PEZI|nr:hypothetical protein B0A49_06862 [Cryomyces minteri]
MSGTPPVELHSLKSIQTADQIQLLDLVDSLRAQGLSEFTALPQLIVCGDQSSGKSSLLEAISGVPFPKKDNLCTRFATEVILRRASQSGLTVSLVPGKARSPADQERLQQFRYELSSSNDFATLFEQAREAMGLSSVGGNAFSDDILRVEIYGPKQPQLTIVDLPGLIHSHNKQQTEHDVELVAKLVARYMENPRSIILAVVSARNDFANQIILKQARKVDPRGQRTLGIITKPDQLAKGTDNEANFLGLARNEQVEFDLGWHVVRNLDSRELNDPDLDRDRVEMDFFASSNFRSLAATTLGIDHLRRRLSHVLFEQIRSELPRLMEDIESGKDSCQTGLDKSGPSRTTIEEQRAFLIDLSDGFQSLCKAAIRGDFEDDFFADGSLADRRLSAMFSNKGVGFEKPIRTQGRQWKIVERVEESTSDKRCRTRTQAIAEVLELVKKSRGRELPGLANPLLVGEVFREYSAPWEGLARDYIKNVWSATRSFIEQGLLRFTDAAVSDMLLRHVLDPIMDNKLRMAYAKLNELLAVHKEHPETRNHYFTDTYNALQKQKSEAAVKERLEEGIAGRKFISKEDIPWLMSLLRENAQPDMDLVAAESTYNAMDAFYKVAMKLFVDNVPNLVVRAIIASQLPSMFCPKSVYAMDSATVKKIASETEDKQIRRRELSEKLAALDAGSALCKQYALRVTSAREAHESPNVVQDESCGETPDPSVSQLGDDPQDVATDGDS